MSQSHTPTPWKAVDVHSQERGKRGLVYFQIKPVNEAKSSIGFAGVYEGGNPKANADFIIQAVNSYDDNQATIAAQAALLQECYEYLADAMDGTEAEELAAKIRKQLGRK